MNCDPSVAAWEFWPGCWVLGPTAGTLRESGSLFVGAGVLVIERGVGSVVAARGGIIIDCVPSTGRPPLGALGTTTGDTGGGPIGVVGALGPGRPG